MVTLSKSGLIILITAGSLGLSGCFHSRIHVPYRMESKTVKHQRVDIADPIFAYERTSVEMKNSVLKRMSDKKYTVRNYRFPSHGINGQIDNLVTAKYYQSKKPGKKKLVIVLPIWGTYIYPPKVITKGILKRSKGDTNVMWVQGDNYLLDWEGMGAAPDEASFIKSMEGTLDRIRNTVIDIRRIVDWAEEQDDIDSERIGLVGFSMGAIVAASAMTNESRISTSVLIMGGANPHEMFATCFGRVQRMREAVLQRFGWTVDEFKNKLEPVFEPINGEKYRGKADPARILMIDAGKDDCLPKTSREDLWKMLGEPERYTFLYPHKMAFLAMTPLGANVMRRKIYRFLEEKL